MPKAESRGEVLGEGTSSPLTTSSGIWGIAGGAPPANAFLDAKEPKNEPCGIFALS